MKYAIIIPEGAADHPHVDLGGKTPLQAAEIPFMDWVAQNGKLGTVCNLAQQLPADSGVSMLSIAGFDPRDYFTGRAPLEAAAHDIHVGPDEWVFRCNLVTIINGIMEDHCAGHISGTEAATIIDQLRRTLDGTGIGVHTGRGYRHLMTLPGDLGVITTPPQEIIGKPIAEFLPQGEGAQVLTTLMDRARELLAMSEINAVRADLGENVATDIWLWGQGQMPKLPNYREEYGLKAAAIAGVDLVKGLARMIGWAAPEISGATGYMGTNYAGKGDAAIMALDNHDMVVVHVEATEEAGLNGDAVGKAKALEKIDSLIVAPIIAYMQSLGEDWRVLVLPGHATPCESRTQTREAVPFAIAGKRIEALLPGDFNESAAAEADLHIEKGYTMMEYFLTVR